MEPEKEKECVKKSLTPYCKDWWKLTLPGTIFLALGTYFLENRALAWDVRVSDEYYLKFILFLMFYTLIDYYVNYRPNLRHHSVVEVKHSILDEYD